MPTRANSIQNPKVQAMNDEEPPLKKNKLPIEATLNLSLPDDLLVSILARVSRLYYPILSLVSKGFRSLLTSSEIYKIRSLLGCTESFLYVCLRLSPTDRIPNWFMLRQRPNRSNTRKKNKSSGYVLETIPIPNSPPVNRSVGPKIRTQKFNRAFNIVRPAQGIVAVGSNIYNIGGWNSPSSSVSILDCLSHTWLEAPSMQEERAYPSASFLDGKIYVTGDCTYKDYNPSNLMEVFDIENKSWEPVLYPAGRLSLYSCHNQTNNVVVDGKLYITGDKGVAYNPKDGSWSSLGPEMELRLKWLSSCVIENVLYYYYYEEGIKWYDSKVRSWRTLNGMKKLPKFARHANVRLADYGGKMALFWDKFVASGGGGGYRNKMIWCAMIALEKRDSEEICGTVEWFDALLPHPIPVGYKFEHVVAVNL